MTVQRPTMWAIAAWLFFLGSLCHFLNAPRWHWQAGLVVTGLCALLAVVTGIVQAREHPDIAPSWHYVLGVLLAAVVVLFVLPRAL